MDHTSIGCYTNYKYDQNTFKGGDPAAPSGTATLLRLRPSYQSHLKQLLPEG